MAFLIALSALSASAADTESEKIKKMMATQIDGTRKLSAQGLTMIEANGRTFLVSDNGRIVVTGRIFDMWNGVELKNISDVDKYTTRIDVGKLKLNADDLGAVSINQGKKEVIAFVDPNNAVSHRFIQSAAKLPGYTFKLVMIPGADEESFEKVKKAACVEDRGAVKKALVDNNWEKLLSEVKECDRLNLQRAIITARIFGVDQRQLPFVIRHDGYYRQGTFKDWDDWLSDVESKSDKPVDKAQSQKSSK